MSSLEEIKRKRLQERMSHQQVNQDYQEQLQLLQQIQALENLVKQYLTKEALGRYTNLKISHTEKSIQLLSILGQLIQRGQIKGTITDEQLKDLIIKITPERKETKIKRI